MFAGPEYVIWCHIQPLQSLCGCSSFPRYYSVARIPGHCRGDWGTTQNSQKSGKRTRCFPKLLCIKTIVLVIVGILMIGICLEKCYIVSMFCGNSTWCKQVCSDIIYFPLLMYCFGDMYMRSRSPPFAILHHAQSQLTHACSTVISERRFHSLFLFLLWTFLDDRRWPYLYTYLLCIITCYFESVMVSPAYPYMYIYIYYIYIYRLYCVYLCVTVAGNTNAVRQDSDASNAKGV